MTIDFKNKLESNEFCTSKSSNMIFFNTCFDKGYIKDLVSWFLKTYGEKKTISFLESLKTSGFSFATKAGISLGIDDLEIPPDKKNLITNAITQIKQLEKLNIIGSLTNVEKSQCLIDIWNQTSDTLKHQAVQNFRIRNPLNPVYIMAFSGARGNISQVRQLVAMRGLMADPQGAILEFPIQSNFREGLTITEYLISCYGARKGLVDTALRTATSGYLTRRLVDSAQHAVVSMMDCGTKNGILIQGKNVEDRLFGRVLSESFLKTQKQLHLSNRLISAQMAKELAKKYNQIWIRSPLTCESATSVCQFCYGSSLASSKLVQIGEAVGVIAAQAIGEPGTQLTMRTFHTGGVGVFSDKSLKPILAPYKGKVIFTSPIPGHFIRTPYGQIVYMVKKVPTSKNKILFKIQPCFVNTIIQEFTIYENDLPFGSLLFVKHGEVVESKQLLIQTSFVKITKQKLPESSHPIYSPNQGQVFFELMNLIIEKASISDNQTSKSKQKKHYKPVFTNFRTSRLPDRRTMSKIGSFWVLSSFNQLEFHTNKCFIESGDLVSPNTIAFNYKFYTESKVQLYKIATNLLFGFSVFEIALKKIYFVKNKYIIEFFNLKQKRNYFFQKSTDLLLFEKYNIKNSIGIWYPNSSQQIFPFKKHFGSYTYSFDLYLQKFLKTFKPKYKIDNIKGYVFIINTKTVALSKRYSQVKRNFLAWNFRNPKLKHRYIQTDFAFFDQDQLKFSNFLLQNFGWPFCTNTVEFKTVEKTNFRQFIPTGTSIKTVLFPKKSISIKTITYINFGKIQKNKKITQYCSRNWYDLSVLINSKQKFYQKNKLNRTRLNKTLYFQNYNLNLGLFWYSFNSTKQNKLQNLILCLAPVKYKKYSPVILVQSVHEYSFQACSQNNSFLLDSTKSLDIRNPLNCKQKQTSRQIVSKPKYKTHVIIPFKSNYYSTNELIRIQLLPIQSSSFPRNFVDLNIIKNKLSRGFRYFLYNSSDIHQTSEFFVETHQDNWILPNQAFSSGSVKIKNQGEFYSKVMKINKTILSIIRPTDVLTTNFIKFDSPETKLGRILRWGQKLLPEIGANFNGQIIKKTLLTTNIRLGFPILASARGILHVYHNDLVQKNQLLITLKSRRLQTEDIVQGIPKIEQLFEARERQGGEILLNTVHMRLHLAFLRELKKLPKHLKYEWPLAVETSFLEAQQFLVENILEAYGNQGVKIDEKHVEVIIRQMTNHVQILKAGDTGLLPGEIVQRLWIKRFNARIRQSKLQEAFYKPIVLGISKSVLHSDSFLLAASFQEVSRVLVGSALSGKKDFLCGLHENVIVGQSIPAGTGLLSKVLISNSLKSSIVSK
jgi:hypothetical protein